MHANRVVDGFQFLSIQRQFIGPRLLLYRSYNWRPTPLVARMDNMELKITTASDEPPAVNRDGTTQLPWSHSHFSFSPLLASNIAEYGIAQAGFGWVLFGQIHPKFDF